jgi:hypothetical protein
VSLSLLLLILAIELSLPQILGSAINQLRWHIDWNAAFDPWVYVRLLLSLVLIRAGLGYVLGPIRNRLISSPVFDRSWKAKVSRWRAS